MFSFESDQLLKKAHDNLCKENTKLLIFHQNNISYNEPFISIRVRR